MESKGVLSAIVEYFDYLLIYKHVSDYFVENLDGLLVRVDSNLGET